MNEVTVVGITMAVTEVIKRTGLVPSHFAPILSVVVGSVVGFVFFNDLVSGFVSGLVASGVYDVAMKSGKTTVKTLLK